MHLHLNNKQIPTGTTGSNDNADISDALTSNSSVAQRAAQVREHRAMAGGEQAQGQALPADLQSSLGRSFAGDVSSVRVHQGAHVSDMGAQAYARGNQLHFAPGQYQPGTSAGRDLIGHEMTHVAQQAQGVVSAPAQAKGGVDSSSTLEREADTVGAVVASGGAAPAHLQGIDVSVAAGRVAQCRLPVHGTYRVDLTDLQLVAIADKVQAYNLVADSRGDSSEYQECFNKLQKVERAAYAWFKTVSTANVRLSGNPNSDLVQALLTAAETEQQDLIAASKARADVLPFDTTGIAPLDLPALKTLWQDMVNNRGKIKIVGSAGYNKRIYGELAKLLSTPTGRSMLALLNEEKRPGDSVNEKKMTDVYIGETTDQMPASVVAGSPGLEEQTRSEAQPLGIDDSVNAKKLEAVTEVTVTDVDPHAPPNALKFPTVRAGELRKVREYSWDSQYDGYVHSGKKYTFNRAKGTGAFVTSFPGVAVHPGKGGGNEIQSPGWVTLGHELGHVANMRMGATSLKTAGKTMETLTGSRDTDKWDNTEELLNIENVENAVLDEAGLHERDGHRPPPWALAHATGVRSGLKRPLDVLYQGNNTWYQDPEWSSLYRRAGTMKVTDTLDDGTVAALTQEIADLVPTKANAALPGYLLQISEDQPKATSLMGGLANQAAKDNTFLYLHNNQGKFTDIKAKLHHGFWARRGKGNNSASRLTRRRVKLAALVAGTDAV